MMLPCLGTILGHGGDMRCEYHFDSPPPTSATLGTASFRRVLDGASETQCWDFVNRGASISEQMLRVRAH